jgi:predicted SAM-dependent methyltransferase
MKSEIKELFRPLKSRISVSVKLLYHRLNNRFILGLKLDSKSTKLHLGCGDNLLPGWSNVDFNSWAGVIEHNLTRPLPLKAESVEFIFTEHFIEHITRDEALALVKDCYKVLKPGGVLRISTPNLKTIVAQYLEEPKEEWKDWDWRPETTCQMLNGSVRLWGHQFIYDFEEINLLLHKAGFEKVQQVAWRESSYEALKGLENRPHQGDLIVEAVK